MARYDFRIDGRELLVIDGVLPPARVGHLATFFDFTEARRLESDSAGGIDARSWIVEIENDVASRQPYYEPILHEVGLAFPGETFTLKRAYCNVVSFGDILLPHRDSAADADLTALLFVADAWERTWGGETIFYNDAGDAVNAVTPQPGRLILFRSKIEHRGTAPSRLCTRTRLTLALKLTGTRE